MTDAADAIRAFQRWTREQAGEILVNSLAYAVAQLAQRALDAQAAEIARLNAELDNYTGRTVYHCTDAQMEDACTTLLADAQPGSILRATDTGREYVLRAADYAGYPGVWELR